MPVVSLNSRAEALATFEEAGAAYGQLVTAASAALDATAGPDMATLRGLLGSGSTAGARFKARKNFVTLTVINIIASRSFLRLQG